MNCNTGQFGHCVLFVGIECRAGNHGSVTLDDREVVYLCFEQFTRATNKDAFLLERFNQRKNTADIIDTRLADEIEGFRAHESARTVTREKLLQQGALDAARHQVNALDTLAAGCGRLRQQQAQLGRERRAACQCHIDLGGCQMTEGLAATFQRFSFGQQDQLVSIDRSGDGRCDIGCTEVEDLAGRGVTERRYYDQVAGLELVADRPGFDSPDLAGIEVVGTVAHANRPCRHEVAGGHANPGAGHR